MKRSWRGWGRSTAILLVALFLALVSHQPWFSSTAVYDSSSLQKTKTHVAEDILAVAIENFIVKNTGRLLNTSGSNCLLEKTALSQLRERSKIYKI